MGAAGVHIENETNTVEREVQGNGIEMASSAVSEGVLIFILFYNSNL